jgi:hypothetical protein
MPTTKPIASPRNDPGERCGPHAALAAASEPLAVAGQRAVRALAAAGAALAAGLRA